MSLYWLISSREWVDVLVLVEDQLEGVDVLCWLKTSREGWMCLYLLKSSWGILLG